MDPYLTRRFKVAYILLLIILVELFYTFYQSDMIDTVLIIIYLFRNLQMVQLKVFI